MTETLPSTPPSRSASSTAPTTHHIWNSGCVVAWDSNCAAMSASVDRFCADVLAADPAEQRELESRPHPAGQVGGRRLGVPTHRSRGLVGAQVEQQQRALGEQRTAAHGTQVVQQRQQRERHVASARGDPLDVGRQLLDRPHQRIEAVGVGLARRRMPVHVLRDLLHFLAEQRAAVDLGEAQRAPRQVDVGRETVQRDAIVRTLGERLERGARFVQFSGDLARDQRERSVGLVGQRDGVESGAHGDWCNPGLNP